MNLHIFILFTSIPVIMWHLHNGKLEIFMNLRKKMNYIDKICNCECVHIYKYIYLVKIIESKFKIKKYIEKIIYICLYKLIHL